MYCRVYRTPTQHRVHYSIFVTLQCHYTLQQCHYTLHSRNVLHILCQSLQTSLYTNIRGIRHCNILHTIKPFTPESCIHTLYYCTPDIRIYICVQCHREVGGWGRDPFSRNLMSPTPRRKWYLTTGRRAH